MSISRKLLGLSCILLVLRPVVSENGLNANFCNKTLQLLPSDLPTNVTNLTLGHNLIQMTEEDIGVLKNYTKLRELYLDNNKIPVLSGHMFDSLSNLEILSLSENSIGRVDPKAFTGLGTLKKLDLSHNPLQSLPLGLFESLGSLESLSLRDIGLQSLENDILQYLVKLKTIDLQENPWNCTCDFLKLIRNSGVQISQEIVCASPKDREGKSLLDRSICLPKMTTTTMKVPSTVKSTTTQATNKLTPGQNNNLKSMDRAAAPDSSENVPQEGNTWKFLVGVLLTVLCTSTLLVGAVKGPSWYKLLFNYRHQRLREEEEAGIFTTSNYSTFSGGAEQMDTDMCDLDVEMEDGYIEDRYIDSEDYRAVDEA